MKTHASHHGKETKGKKRLLARGSFKDGSAFCAAYERRLAEIEAVPEGELLPVNVDLEAAVTTILGTVPGVHALRGQLATLPEFDIAEVDALPEYAQAAGEANSRYLIAVGPPQELATLNEEALALRDTLRSDALALAKHGLIDSSRLASFTGHTGYRNVAFELMGWANVLRDSWEQIAGKTVLQATDISRAKALAEQLILAVGEKEQSPDAISATARIRQQAFTLMVNAYEHTRRGVAFVRWKEDDADAITPSLYAGRGRRPKPGEPAPEPTPAPVPPVVNPTPPPTSATPGSTVH